MASGSSLPKITPSRTKISASFDKISSTNRTVQRTKIKFLSSNDDIKKRRCKTGPKSPLLSTRKSQVQRKTDTEKKVTETSDHKELPRELPTYLQDLEKAFAIFDKNRDGSITKVEIGAVLEEADIKFTDKQLDVFMSKLDRDGNGDVNYEEFCTLMKDVVRTAYRRDSIMRDTFKNLDVNGDGNISQSELRSALGDNMTDNDAEEVIRIADKNGDGEINYGEFTSMMHLLNLTPN